MSDDDPKLVTGDAKLKAATGGLHPVDVQVLKEAQAGEGVALTLPRYAMNSVCVTFE